MKVRSISPVHVLFWIVVLWIPINHYIYLIICTFLFEMKWMYMLLVKKN
jgi:hypothetical protein